MDYKEQARHLKHGYMASVTYVDTQVGRLWTSLKNWEFSITRLWYYGATMAGSSVSMGAGSNRIVRPSERPHGKQECGGRSGLC